jgi:hypothetical protein
MFNPVQGHRRTRALFVINEKWRRLRSHCALETAATASARYVLRSSSCCAVSALLKEAKAVVTQYHKYLSENSLIKTVVETDVSVAPDDFTSLEKQ